MRYEIRDITPPTNIKKAMELEGEAERQKRADILNSEKQRAGEINIAEGKKQAAILRAEGEAEALLLKANSVANGLKAVADSIKAEGGINAIKLKLAEQYVETFGKLAQNNSTMIIPQDNNGITSVIAQALNVYKQTLPEPKKEVQTIIKTKKVREEINNDPILASSD
jgi:Membrane protease subunits, stomatin/prohibitin homologs